MRVEALSALSCGSVQWTSPNGQSFATIVAKLTFDIHPTQIALSGEQIDVVQADKFYDDDPGRSLYAPSDLAPFKARADVVLVGHVYAPNREPARVVRARLAIRECEKALEVYGDRAWGMDGEIREGPRFLKMPLRWERSAGGPYTMNPVGIRSDVQDSLGRILVPNVMIAGRHAERRGESIEPAGFGPLAASWPARRPLGEAAASGRPGHAEPAFYNCAPADQQLTELPEDEQVILENLHPSAPAVAARLPGIRPRAFVDHGEVGVEVPLRCDTMWIDADRALLTLTWRGRLPLNESAGDVVWLMTEHRGSPVTWASILAARAASGTLGDLDPSSVTHVPTTKEPNLKGETLPFSGKRPDADGHKTFQSTPPAWVNRPPAQSPLAQLGAMTQPSASSSPPPLAPQPTVSMQAYESAKPPPMVAPPAPVPSAPGPMAAPVPPPPVASVPPAPPPVAPVAGAPRKEALELLWLDPRAPERLGGLNGDGRAGRERRDVLAALLTGKRLESGTLATILSEAVEESGALALPSVVAAGELVLSFDPRERLSATIAVAKPHAGSNKPLAEVCREGVNLITSEVAPPPGLLEGATARIREVLPEGPSAFDEGIDRLLVVRRAYERHLVFGGAHLRGTITLGSGGSVTVYLPESVASELPILARFPVTVFGDLRPQQDPYDVSPVVLLGLALGRRVPLDRGGGRTLMGG